MVVQKKRIYNVKNIILLRFRRVNQSYEGQKLKQIEIFKDLVHVVISELSSHKYGSLFHKSL